MGEEKNKISVTVSKTVAEKDTQLILKKSDLKYSDEVEAIEEKLKTDGENPVLWLEKATALSKQMLYREAIDAVSRGLSYDPLNYRLIRYRAGKYMGLHRVEEAASELELAYRIKGDDWDILYHLGLCYYLTKRYDRALPIYRRCLNLTDKTDMNLVAIVNWLWLTLKKSGLDEEAKQVLTHVSGDTVCGENQPYKDMVLAYKREITADEAMTFDNEEFKDIEFSTRGYGIAMMHIFEGRHAEGNELLHKIIEADTYWNAFGYIAACIELNI